MDEEDPGAVQPRPLAAGEMPPFRFIRVGPKSTKASLSRALLGALAEAMVEGPEGPDGRIPAGYTYLGQFLDHDLTMDRTQGRLGDEVDLADLRQGRSPSLDLDSLYGARPRRRGGREVLQGRRPAPEAGQERTVQRPRPAPCRARAGGRPAQGGDPGPPQRREPGHRPDPRRDDELPQPGGRPAARQREEEVEPPAVPARAAAGDAALPVAGPARLPAAHLRPQGRQRRLQERSEDRAAERRPALGAGACPSSSRSPPSGSGTRWCGATTTGTGSSRARPAGCSTSSPSPRRAGTSASTTS